MTRSKAALPETDLRRIEQFVGAQWPERFHHEVFWETHIRGRSVTICETREHLLDAAEPWTHQHLAQLRYRPESGDWAIYWADRNSRWHPYDMHGAAMTGTCAELLAEIDDDPAAIFKG